MTPVTDLQLNRWTLARQLLLEREAVDAVTAVERLAGMQAQHSPSPYIGLWSRVRGFERSELETAVMEDRVVKATLMRGTLHLVPARQFDLYRAATRNPRHLEVVRRLGQRGVDVAALRAAIVAAVREGPLTRAEVARVSAVHVPDDLFWGGWSAVGVSGDLMNLREDARFGYFGSSRYRLAPEATCDPEEARLTVVAAYLRAFGPATRSDLAQWSGQSVAAFAAALERLGVVRLRAIDGRELLDLADAPRPEPDGRPPVRFLPKWDNLLLAYTRRQRVLPEPYRAIVIRKNGDVLPTFLVDGRVAGTWEAPRKGRALMSLTALAPLRARDRREVEEEGERLHAWLRPDTDRRAIAWR